MKLVLRQEPFAQNPLQAEFLVPKMRLICGFRAIFIMSERNCKIQLHCSGKADVGRVYWVRSACCQLKTTFAAYSSL